MCCRKNDIRKFILCLYDLLCTIVSIFAASKIQGCDFTNLKIVIIVVVHFAVFYISNLSYYFERRGYLDELRIVFSYEIYNLIFLALIIFITGSYFEMSRHEMALFLMCDAILLYISHTILKFYFKRVIIKRSERKKIYLLTTKDRVNHVLELLKNIGLWEKKIAGIILFECEEIEETEIEGIPVVASYNDYLEYAKSAVVDQVFIYMPSDTIADMKTVIHNFQNMGVRVDWNICDFNFSTPSQKRGFNFAGRNVITFAPRLYEEWELIIKRLIDIVAGIVGILLTGIVAMIVAPLIRRESPGPAIFSQYRVGKNGRIFKLYKFRTMCADAEKMKKELKDQNEMNGPIFKIDHDPRITKIGRFLREYSIDELPQFYNVLVGNMSLVGTRPPTLDEYMQYEFYHKRRLSIKPGITGLWQVSGRSNITDFEEILKLDLQYIDDWSVWLDIKIIFKTVKVILTRRGAK